jgi:tetratricopeptide (TPR) repeat protein
MGEVVRRFPDDADVLTLFAEALMTAHGRHYWHRNGAAQRWTPRIVAALERALKNASGHPGANHYYVHVLEDSPYPERALASAERLRSLAPGVGHLVHMPAHVYLRLGDYGAASAANERAIAADRAYLETMCADSKYVAGYVAHNYHFLWASSVMAGRSEVALAAAAELTRYVESAAPRDSLNGIQQHFVVLPLYTQVRFGHWQAIIAAPRPVAATPYTDGVWHYARGMAFLRAGDIDQARRELESLAAALHDAALDTTALKNTNPLSKLLALSARLLKAELAGAAGDAAKAVAHARAAVRIESELDADEPPAWHMPARHTLGALLLQAGRSAAAERVYREDLKIHPANGWALAGLAQSLARQRRATAATEARSRFARAWANADVELGGSRF